MLLRIALMLFLSVPAFANVLGDMQTFAPNSDGLDFITVHTSRPLTKGFFALGGHFSFARNHLVVFKDFNSQDRYNYKDSLIEFDLDVAYALTDKLSVFFAAPTLLYQESDSGQDVDVDISKGVHTYRPGFKWTFGSGPSEFAVVGSIDILNVTNSPYTGIDSFPIYNLEFAKTWKRPGKVAWGLNAGYRWRAPTDIPLDANMFPLDDQITFSIGRSAPIFQKSRWVLEGIFSVPADQHPYKRMEDASSIDLLIGFKHRLARNFNLDWGGTIEPGIDTQSPMFRAYAGLVYYFNPGWTSNQDRETVPPPAATSEPEKEDDRAAVYDDDAMEVTPALAEVYEGTVVRYRVKGGDAPYKFRVLVGRGKINSAERWYRAPLVAEEATIEVTDARGRTKTVEVIVRTPPKPNETIRIKNLNFYFDTDRLIPESKKEINRIIKLFQNRDVSRIIVEGHTDSKGSNEYNLQLSERRAETVRRALIEGLALREDQVTAIGFGEERPIATNATEKGRLMNRRVDLKVYYR